MTTTRKTPVRRQPRSQPRTVTHEIIALRAYELFLLRGGTHGYDRDDWLAAERELSAAPGPAPRRRATT